MIYTIHSILLDDQIKEDGVGETCIVDGGKQKFL
jgi:hypothetical protein